MDPITNPFVPGAGSQPPELAGRDELREFMRVAIARTRLGKPSKSILMVGLRGVGKTVLLDKIRSDAEATGVLTVRIEAPEGRSLPAILAPELRQVLIHLSRVEKAKDLAKRAQRALAGFVGALRLTYDDIHISMDTEPEEGLADNGDLEHDLQVLLSVVGEAARAAGTAVAIFIDELQYVKEDELAAMIVALHRASQQSLPVIMVGAGLPQLRGRVGEAKSYAERLFDFPEVDALPDEAARRAVAKPVQDEGVEITSKALDKIVEQTHGYPYFLQEWGKHVWDVADESPIREEDVVHATEAVIAALDKSFFLVRFDRLAPLEKRYIRAMAELGPGPHRSGDVADILGRPVTSLGPTRSTLISKGMVWSPSHGDTAFTVPLFDQFMKRIISDDSWRG